MLVPVARLLYSLGMYTGLRALRSTLTTRLVRQWPAARARLHGSTVGSEALGALHCWVHARRGPRGERGRRRVYGMLSLRLRRPPVHPLLYRYLCLTSHFGRGHLEAAFYEEGDRCVIYALRNMAQANARRLGCRAVADALTIGHPRDDAALLGEALRVLAPHYSSVSLAPPREALHLAVDPRLLHPRHRRRTLRSLRSRYRKLLAAAEPGRAS